MTDRITERVAEFLERQIAVLEAMRDELPAWHDAFEQRIDAEAADLQRRREAALATMVNELAPLKEEWENTSEIGREQRERVQALSNRARDLIAEVQPMLAESIAMARGGLDRLDASLGELRRGKQVMRAYKTRDGVQGGGLDRQG